MSKNLLEIKKGHLGLNVIDLGEQFGLIAKMALNAHHVRDFVTNLNHSPKKVNRMLRWSFDFVKFIA